jgi:hypothetical protein
VEKRFFKELSSFLENFESKKDFNRYWSNDSQNTKNKKYSLEDKRVKLTTASGTEERVKIRFNKTNLTFGTYEWRVYVPKMRMNENCSIGAFLYRDDGHELDFEIGSGNSKDRAEVAAKRDELLLFCTSQGNPSSSKKVKILEEAWYVLKLKMELGAKNKYLVKWYLNNKKIHEVQTNYGKRFKFEALCSLENIHFIGDKPTTQDNYTLFDYFKYSAAE